MEPDSLIGVSIVFLVAVLVAVTIAKAAPALALLIVFAALSYFGPHSSPERSSELSER